MRTRGLAVVALVVWGLLVGPREGVAHGSGHAADSSAQPAPAPSSLHLPDVPLVDQDGRAVHFYRDLVQGKVVAINFVYTTCTTVCPLLHASFSRLQQLLGARLGTEVHLLSLSVDPVTDTPARLHALAQRLRAAAGWTFATGTRGDTTRLLKALRVFTPAVEDHAPLILLGNERRGAWTRVYGLTPPEHLLRLLETLGDTTKTTANLEGAP